MSTHMNHTGMRRAVINSCVVALVLSLVPLVALAQGSRPRRVTGDDNPQEAEPLALESALVEIPTVVSDRSGRYVPGLNESDFEVYENGERQDIAFFRDDRVPIHVALVMDTSNSTRLSLGDIQEAAIEFTNLLMPGDQILVVSFNDEVRVEQEFTSDRGLLVSAIRRTSPRKGTRLYDAVYETVAQRMRGIDGRKAMVLLSDGQDNLSDRSFDEAVKVCSESDVIVYGIRYPSKWQVLSGGAGVPNPNPSTNPGSGKLKKRKTWRIPNIPGVPGIPGVGWPLQDPWNANQQSGGGRKIINPFMETVTANSGGQLFYANAVSDIRGLFAQVAEELRHVYVLAYSPSNPQKNGGYRTIEVRVVTHPDATVRHRLGYQATASP